MAEPLPRSRERRARADAARVSPRGRGRGAALTELVVLTLLLVPLIVGIPMLGKLIDVRLSAVQASRYAVWEASVDAQATPPTNVAERFFGDPANAIVSRPTAPGENPLWGPASRGGAASDPRFGAADVRVDPARVAALAYAEVPDTLRGEGVARRGGEAVRAAGEALAGSTGGRWDLTADGLLLGGVHVEIAGDGWFAGDRAACAAGAWRCVEERSVIMIDGWSAGGAAMARERARSLVPMGALGWVGDLLATIGKVPVFKELKGLEDAFGHVDVEHLPENERRRRTLEPYPGAPR